MHSRHLLAITTSTDSGWTLQQEHLRCYLFHSVYAGFKPKEAPSGQTAAFPQNQKTNPNQSTLQCYSLQLHQSYSASLAGPERSKEQNQTALEREPSGQPRHALQECNYPDLTHLMSAVQPLALHFTVTAILKKPTKPNQTKPLSAADRHHLLNIIISLLSKLKRWKTSPSKSCETAN